MPVAVPRHGAANDASPYNGICCNIAQAQQHVAKLEQQLQQAEDAALASQIAAEAEAAAAVERLQTQCTTIREAATAEGLASGDCLLSLNSISVSLSSS